MFFIETFNDNVVKNSILTELSKFGPCLLCLIQKILRFPENLYETDSRLKRQISKAFKAISRPNKTISASRRTL